MEKYSYYDVCQVLEKGTLEEIQKLCEEIGPNAFINKDKWTLLHAASIRGRSDIVQFLINLGSNVNALDKDEKSALYYCKSEEGAKMLITAGANVNQASILGKTPLHYASLSMASPSVVEVILQSGGQINAEDKFGVVKGSGWVRNQSERSIGNFSQSESRIWPTWQGWPGGYFWGLVPRD